MTLSREDDAEDEAYLLNAVYDALYDDDWPLGKVVG